MGVLKHDQTNDGGTTTATVDNHTLTNVQSGISSFNTDLSQSRPWFNINSQWEQAGTLLSPTQEMITIISSLLSPISSPSYDNMYIHSKGDKRPAEILCLSYHKHSEKSRLAQEPKSTQT